MNYVKSKAKSLKSMRDSDSAYNYESSFRDDATSAYGSDDDDDASDDDDDSGEAVSRRTSSYASGDDVDAHLSKADKAMDTLNDLHSKQSSSWKRALKHRSGCVVYYSKDKLVAGHKKNGKEYLAPVYKGELDIRGYNPAEVFGVVGSRHLWDEWYKEGNLVENLSDTSSLTYMCMQGIAGSSTRDLSLVEKVAGSPTGTISFVSTSVVTPKVPRVSGRVRASIALNGWVLEPIDGGTKVSYYLLVNVKTFVPAMIHKKYLARRPTCIARIDAYLQKNGPVPMAGVDREATDAGDGASTRRRRRSSISSKRSARSAASGVSMAGLIAHVSQNTDADNYSEVQKAVKLFKQIADGGKWKQAVDNKGNKIFFRERDEGLPAVKGEAKVNGVTTEQVLATILSTVGRKRWDGRFLNSTLLSSDNGFDQGEYLEEHKGIWGSLDPRYYTVVRGIEREEPSSPHGEILVVQRSIKSSDKKKPSDESAVKGQMDVQGFLLSPASESSVKITSISQLDIKDDDLKPHVRRILISEQSRLAAALAEYVDDFGYAPGFFRWGEGPATLDSDANGDLGEGRVVYKIGGEGKGTMKDGQQKAWLQYSDKMYERGIDISVEPDDAVTLAKVDGLDRTVEFVWSDKVKKGVTVTLTRARGQGAEDVLVDGDFLDKTVQMEKGSGGAMGARKKSKRETSQNPDDRSDGSEKTMVDDQDGEKQAKSSEGGRKGLVGAAAAAGGAVAAAGGAVASRARSASSTVASPIAPAQIDQEKRGNVPSDAMLIISQDLYFTKSQVMVMAGLLAAAYVWGKLS
ncbi:hypothetical protein ACM66B_004557 [Microbotryomycetes sp. NB124-2]